MSKPISLIRRLACPIWVGGLVFASWSLLGCSDGGVADSIRVPASKRPDLSPQAQDGAIHIPVDQAYNIVAFRSGQEGMARGEAQAIEQQGAAIKAEASDGGSAWAEFQLGYCFDNITDKPLKGIVRFQLESTEITTSIKGRGADAASPTSTAGINLTAFIKNSAGVRLKDEPLAATTLLKGPSSSSRPYDLVFELDIAPMTGYYIVLSGRTDVKALAGQSASATLTVPKCTLDVRWNPQNANRTATADGENTTTSQPADIANAPASNS